MLVPTSGLDFGYGIATMVIGMLLVLVGIAGTRRHLARPWWIGAVVGAVLSLVVVTLHVLTNHVLLDPPLIGPQFGLLLTAGGSLIVLGTTVALLGHSSSVRSQSVDGMPAPRARNSPPIDSNRRSS